MPWELPSKDYPENEVLALLLTGSGQFARYYRNRRAKIPGKILWHHEPNRIPAIYSFVDANDVQHVTLADIPALPEHAWVVAHELEHLVIYAEGFPQIQCVAEQDLELAWLLNDLTHEPLNHIRVRTFGFGWANGTGLTPEGLRDSLIAIDRWRAGPPGTFCVDYVLQYAREAWWHVCRHGKQPRRGKNEILDRIEQAHPEIAFEGLRLLGFIEQTGIDKPARMQATMRLIIDRYRLHDRVFIRP